LFCTSLWNCTLTLFYIILWINRHNLICNSLWTTRICFICFRSKLRNMLSIKSMVPSYRVPLQKFPHSKDIGIPRSSHVLGPPPTFINDPLCMMYAPTSKIGSMANWSIKDIWVTKISILFKVLFPFALVSNPPIVDD